MSARAGKKSLLIVREKVLLHILSYHKYLQDPDAPASATQEGIADAVSVGRNNISKIVNALAKEGLVEVQTKHVKGFATVKRVYFLLPKGFEAALELKKEIESVPVGIIDFDGKVHRDVVGKIGVYLPKRYTFLEMVTGVHQGKFDCASFHEGKARKRGDSSTIPTASRQCEPSTAAPRNLIGCPASSIPTPHTSWRCAGYQASERPPSSPSSYRM